ncbi:DNA polymerase III subunit delta' [Chamaesiphon sp. VAR_48_metabat_135_sub]|uniref:DNA polymerase III subunit delta' n=1 Tax=Chamaesiphon sp. VAR_48_metabat_135_sub TaxID=2964699 RepID=UPI00286CAE79|nr:DNA polymerase III subunit delta' [Chamaesiphon sp. VAR_48_metabat_135_sub]
MTQFSSALLGQTQAVELLTQSIVKQRLAPAYLFYGADGIGKSLAARCFIESICCDRIPEHNQALITQKLRQGNHPDVLWVAPTYKHQDKLLSAAEATAAGIKKKAPPQIRIEQIREIGQFLARPPLLGLRSVIAIEHAETMPEGAANALLKTLEEPGKATIIAIASSVESLLPTIVSRCQRIQFQRLDRALMVEILTKLGRTEILDRPEILGLAQGSPGAAIALWEQLQTLPIDLIDRLTKLPLTRRQGLELAIEIDRDLDSSAQLWLVDYLQYIYWQKYRVPQTIELLEQTRSQLLAYVQPRLVWECTFLKLGSRGVRG